MNQKLKLELNKRALALLFFIKKVSNNIEKCIFICYNFIVKNKGYDIYVDIRREHGRFNFNK